MNQQHKTVTHARSTNDLAQGIGAVRTVALLGLRLQLCSPVSDEYELLLLLLLLLLRPPPPPPSPRASVSLRVWWLRLRGRPGSGRPARGPHLCGGRKKKIDAPRPAAAGARIAPCCSAGAHHAVITPNSHPGTCSRGLWFTGLTFSRSYD